MRIQVLVVARLDSSTVRLQQPLQVAVPSPDTMVVMLVVLDTLDAVVDTRNGLDSMEHYQEGVSSMMFWQRGFLLR